MTTCRCTAQVSDGRYVCNACVSRYRAEVRRDVAEDKRAFLLAAVGRKIQERGLFMVHPSVKAKERKQLVREQTPRGAVAIQRPGRSRGENRVYDWTRTRHEVLL